MAITKLHYRQRREKMARFLRKLKPEQFDIKTWSNPMPCGTASCALGWCPVLFKEHWHNARWPDDPSAGQPRLRSEQFAGFDRPYVDHTATQIADKLPAAPYRA